MVDTPTVLSNIVSGPFEVGMTPMPAELTADSGLGCLSLEKTYHGALEATGKGFMLSVRSISAQGSAGYVAMECVSGTLADRSGTFVLQHSGTITRGAPNLTVTVVPDSGTDSLTGLTGKMDIKNEAGHHKIGRAHV